MNYEVAQDFERVYSYLGQRLTQANIKKDKEILEEVNQHLRAMRQPGHCTGVLLHFGHGSLHRRKFGIPFVLILRKLFLFRFNLGLIVVIIRLFGKSG